MCVGGVLVGKGNWEGGGGRAPKTSLSPAPVPSRPSPHHSQEKGSPQPVGASEGPEGVAMGRPASSLDTDLSILSQLLCQCVAVLGGSFSQV